MDEDLTLRPRAYWYCKPCGIGASQWYEGEIPKWNCPLCGTEHPNYTP